MNKINDLKFLFNSFFNRNKSNRREMKRVFQWRRYLEWKDLTPEEKISTKRFLLVPVFAYLLSWIFKQYFYAIVLFLIGYVLYKIFEKGSIVKK